MTTAVNLEFETLEPWRPPWRTAQRTTETWAAYRYPVSENAALYGVNAGFALGERVKS
jgi:hypothetical protein